MEWYIIVIIVVIVLILSFLISIPIYLAWQIGHPYHSSEEEVINNWKKHRFVSEYDKSIRKPVEFKMKDGYIIHGDYILNNNSKKFVICAHGFSTNREAEIEYALIFLNLGFSVVLYDQRGHGKNDPYVTTMGKLESSDLNEIIDQVYELFGKDIKIGLHGVSLGASTCLLVASKRSDLAFIVDDCGYVRLRNAIISEVNKRHLPGVIFIPLTSLFCKLFYGFYLKDVSVEKSIKDIKAPVLIFHGDIDNIVPIKNSYILNDNLLSYHELKVYKDTHHADCLTNYKEDYEQDLQTFIKRINI